MWNYHKEATDWYRAHYHGGFADPSWEHRWQWLDFDAYLQPFPRVTRAIYADTDAVRHCRIHTGDLLVVNIARPPKDHSIILVDVEGEILLRQFRIYNGIPWLIADSEYYPNRSLANTEHRLIGVVTHSIKNFQKKIPPPSDPGGGNNGSEG